jgi:HAD superfamily hydrolase (TIGR01509 family)
MTAILFGSISTLADTSELQREAFNDAFRANGLDWHWDRDTYRGMLTGNGGVDRIAGYADARGEVVDATALHAAKTDRFHELLASSTVAARAGVVECIRAAQDRGIAVAVATTTSPANVTAVLEAAELDVGVLAFVLDADRVQHPKPDPEVYRVALDLLAQPAGTCIAVEDNAGGVAAATAAGLPCVAFPNENTVGHEFTGAVATTDHIDLDGLLTHLGVAP